MVISWLKHPIKNFSSIMESCNFPTHIQGWEGLITMLRNLQWGIRDMDRDKTGHLSFPTVSLWYIRKVEDGNFRHS